MLVTRCPECATAFRCHPEQLEQAKGWVRCGRCSAVFEAVQQALAMSASVDDAARREPSMQGWTELAAALEPERRQAPGRTGAVARWPRSLLTLTALILLLLLPAQWWIGQRDRMAAQSPLWRGLWSQACGWIGCELAWPRLPQALRIESIRMEPGAAGSFDVQLQIRNAATHPVAAPWVELSLLGLRDEVLVRRAVSPLDVGLDPSVLALREIAAGFRFQLPDDVAPNVAGYKAILFYP